MPDFQKVDLSVIIPCYNEMQVINDSIPRIKAMLDALKYSYEIILFDDGSTDGTRLVGPEFAKNDKNIRWYAHEKNCGRGRTVSDGIKLSRGKIVGFIDMDLEVPPEYILPFILEIEKGADIVVAVRIVHSNFDNLPFFLVITDLLYLFLRFIISRGYGLLVRILTGVSLKDTEAGFKFFNREKILVILEEIEDNHWFWDTEIMVRSYFRGLKIEEHRALFLKNLKKKSTVRIFKDS